MGESFANSIRETGSAARHFSTDLPTDGRADLPTDARAREEKKKEDVPPR